MSLWIEWETDTDLSLQKSREKLFAAVTKAALKEEDVKVPCEVSLTITSAEEIRELNRSYRDIDRVTDVLSFPQFDYEGEAPAAFLETAERDPDSHEVVLGDIVICLDRAKEQAEEFGHSLERELGFLCAHSMLHLMGYDHMTEEEEKIMFSKQEIILDSIGLTRDFKGEF